MYATIPDPTTDSVFLVGGVISHITKEKVDNGKCYGCFTITDTMSVYDTTIDDGLGFADFVLISALCSVVVLGTMSLIWRKLRRKKKKSNNDDQEIRFTDNAGVTSVHLDWRNESIVI